MLLVQTSLNIDILRISMSLNEDAVFKQIYYTIKIKAINITLSACFLKYLNLVCLSTGKI